MILTNLERRYHEYHLITLIVLLVVMIVRRFCNAIVKNIYAFFKSHFYDSFNFRDDNCELNSNEEEVEDERLRLTDPKMVELIRSEIMDHGPPVEWNDIAGLDYAKSTIQVFIQGMKNPFVFP